MSLPKNIMIVEDEAITQRYLKDILAQYEINVIGCFDNAVHVREALKTTSCDMILMDINIKGSMDGIQLVREILNTYTLPVVFITAYSDEETLEEVLELSPYGFIVKPFSSKEIYVTLKVAYKRFLTDEERSYDADADKYIVINEQYTFSLQTSMLYYRNEIVKLNFKQNKFIEVLVENLNNTVPFEVLVPTIWGTDSIANSTLRTLVYTIRKITPDLPLHSYSKKGYYLGKKDIQ
jgi:DNA-binding response OmpR family regulator